MKIGIVLHRDKPAAVELARGLGSWLAERGVGVAMLAEEAAAAGISDVGKEGLVGADVVVSLGGDGTLLRAAREVLEIGTPVLGINLGRVGFLAEIEVQSVWPAMENLLTGTYRVEERSALACVALDDQGREVGGYPALNEVVVGVGSHRRMARMSVEIKGELFNRYYCDGLILSTPTGSTAYSLSAGGPLVSPQTNLVILTPICSHSLMNRSLILSESDEVCISVPVEDRRDLSVHTDGYDTGLAPGGFGRLVVKSHKKRFRLVHIEEHSFYAVLRCKLAIWDADEGR